MYRQQTTLDYFRTLVAEPEKIPLLEAAIALASDEHPQLDIQDVLLSFDQLSRHLTERCREISTEEDRLKELISFFFQDIGFSGNYADFYAPDNSYIHRVLASKKGIPISLSVLLIELATNLGLQAHGISFPGHFLMRIDLHSGQVIFDPCSGKNFSQIEIDRAMVGLNRDKAFIDRKPWTLRTLLAPATSVEILMRMLRNLENIHQRSGQVRLLEKVQARMHILSGSS